MVVVVVEAHVCGTWDSEPGRRRSYNSEPRLTVRGPRRSPSVARLMGYRGCARAARRRKSKRTRVRSDFSEFPSNYTLGMGSIRSGDVIAFSGKDFLSAVIQVGTFSLPRRGLSHCGIVSEIHGEPVVYESTSFGRPACYRQGQQVSGVQAHRLDDMLEFVGDQDVWHYPLRRALYPHEADRLAWALDSLLGRPYDLPSAVRSGGLVFNVLQSVLRREDLSAIFCSELVCSSLVDCGVFLTRSASRWSPNKLIRALLRQGVVAEPRRLK